MLNTQTSITIEHQSTTSIATTPLKVYNICFNYSARKIQFYLQDVASKITIHTSFRVRTVYTESQIILFCCISSFRYPVSLRPPISKYPTPTFRMTLPRRTVKSSQTTTDKINKEDKNNCSLISFKK